MNFPVQDYPYAACFASASLVLSPKGDMGISASLLRSIFSFNLRLRAGLRPLRSKAPLFIVLSPVFYLADTEGAWAFPLCSNAHAHFIVLSPEKIIF